MKSFPVLLLLFLFTAGSCLSQTTRASIHQEQSEHYSKFSFSSEKEWDALRFQENGVPAVAQKSTFPLACTLNKRVFGWNPYWAGSTYLNYDWSLLSDLCHFSYEVDANTGNAITTHGWLSDAAVTMAKSKGVNVHLCAVLFSNHATFLNNATAEQTFITNIISQVQQRGAKGCNIDFEGVLSAQSAGFTAFMIDLCNQMHAAVPGSEISIALPAVDWSAVYDVNAMKNYVDLFIIMGYDYYWSGSATAGPTDPLYNFETGYNYTLTKSITYYLNKNVPKTKLLLGLPYYGREWATSAGTIPSATTASGVARTYNFVKNNAIGNYSSPKWDASSYSSYYAFNSGGWNQCFINSAYSMGKKFDMVNQYGIGGIGIWALGQDDGYTDFWDKIRDKFSDCGSIACVDTIFDMGGPNRNHYDNENYVYTIAPAGATNVSLSFISFNTQSGSDILSVYNGPTTASPLIGSYSGATVPGTINSSGSTLTLQWISNASTNSSGWNAVWNCSASPPANPLVTQNVCPNIGVILGWTNSGNGWFIDVSDDPTFTNFWNKDVSNLTSVKCPGGFANITVPTNFLQFHPNTTYYWRIWNGSTYVNGTSFTTPVCKSTDLNCSGSLDDSGGPSASYSGNEDYTKTIAPVFAASVAMTFSAFDLENGFDSLYIYDGTTIAAPLLGGYTGTASPGTVTGTSGALTLHFVSDPFVNNAGFSSTWTCVQNTGILPVTDDLSSIEIYPNPSKGIINLKMNQFENLKMESAEICNVYGKRIHSQIFKSLSLQIDLSSQPSGIYFLYIKTEDGLIVKKIIKE
jgi:hypothetical protein